MYLALFSGPNHSMNQKREMFKVFKVELRLNQGQKRFQYLNSCVLLYQAAFKGNWKEAKAPLDLYPHMVRDPITEGGDTALHIAAATNHPNFVRELLKLMKKEELEIKNKYGQTALYLAAASGNVIIAEEMVEKNNKLTLTHIESGKRKFTPLHIAALLGHREMVSFLFAETSFEYLSPEERIELLVATISNDLFGMSHLSMIVSLSQLIYNAIASFDVLREILIGHE
uniref:Ankyrin repeat-containing protein n=1 Tax=Quercus lobata TaxID=97700 RepID=A0A7N2MWI9_QUELO